MWSEIKNLVLKKSKNVVQSVIESVIFNQIEYNDNMSIANKFNNYFVYSIKDIRDSIDNVQYINNINERERRR